MIEIKNFSETFKAWNRLVQPTFVNNEFGRIATMSSQFWAKIYAEELTINFTEIYSTDDFKDVELKSSPFQSTMPSSLEIYRFIVEEIVESLASGDVQILKKSLVRIITILNLLITNRGYMI